MQEDKTIMAGTALLAAVLVAVILVRSRWLATWLALVALQQGISERSPDTRGRYWAVP